MNRNATALLLACFGLLAAADTPADSGADAATEATYPIDWTLCATIESGLPHVAVETTFGTFELKLFDRSAPLTTAHFLHLVESGHYDGLIFHRADLGYVIQTGAYTPDFEVHEDDRHIPNESGNGVSNLRGTIAMARVDDPHSANAQFFINISDNTNLDPDYNRWGYAVFGCVIDSMAIADRIAEAEVSDRHGLKSVPLAPVIIRSMRPVEAAGGE